MGEVVILFHPERWLAAWELLGGRVYLSAFGGGFAPDGEWVDALLDLGPTFKLNEPWDSPARRKVAHLRKQIEMPEARAMLVAYLERRQATRGCI